LAEIAMQGGHSKRRIEEQKVVQKIGIVMLEMKMGKRINQEKKA
jgi:hypothetical protein